MLRIRLESAKGSSSVKLANILVSTSNEGKSFFFLKISGCISFPFDSLIYFTLSYKNVTHIGVNICGVKSLSGTFLPACSEAYEVKSVKHISQ